LVFAVRQQATPLFERTARLRQATSQLSQPQSSCFDQLGERPARPAKEEGSVCARSSYRNEEALSNLSHHLVVYGSHRNVDRSSRRLVSGQTGRRVQQTLKLIIIEVLHIAEIVRAQQWPSKVRLVGSGRTTVPPNASIRHFI
jgi:hypothetical protein